MSSSSSNKPRQPRLRASCDGCFLAKVKCSKARPICSRCLACGIDCRYSPSSRAGKPKSDSSANHHTSHADLAGMSPIGDDKTMLYSTPNGSMPALYTVETGWTTPPTSVDGGMSRSHSISSEIAMLGVAGTPADAMDAMGGGDMYPSSMPWTPPNDMSAASFAESPALMSTSGHEHSRSHSYDVALSGGMTSWADPFAYGHTTSGPGGAVASSFFPSPQSTPNVRPTAPRHKSTAGGSSSSGGSCTCFTVCLQSLQALHNASSPASPPFDLVLSLNRKAVEGCAAMLACPRCMSRSGTHTAAMLLATIIGKITSFYKNASQSYFDTSAAAAVGQPMIAASPASTTGLGVSFGAYVINDEDGRWLELEILARELRKLEEVYARFREVCADLSEDAEVSRAMIGYLGQNLGSTLEVVSHRKGHMSYA